ncbi:MAG: hypothetical protein Q9157_002665 [Trypethelium eluteriae]
MDGMWEYDGQLKQDITRTLAVHHCSGFGFALPPVRGSCVLFVPGASTSSLELVLPPSSRRAAGAIYPLRLAPRTAERTRTKDVPPEAVGEEGSLGDTVAAYACWPTHRTATTAARLCPPEPSSAQQYPSSAHHSAAEPTTGSSPLLCHPARPSRRPRRGTPWHGNGYPPAASSPSVALMVM